MHLAWPMFIEELTAGVTGFTDTLFISMISDEAAASVGILGPVLWLGYFILPQFSSAGGSVAAQYLGAGQRDRAVSAWTANVIISAAFGSLLAVLMLAFSINIGLWLGMTPSQNEYAGQYLSVIAFNFVIAGLRFSYGQVLASQTLTRWNMVASVTTNLLNIPLNWLLMRGFWFVPALGVRGIALATCLSYLAGLAIVLYMTRVRLGLRLFARGVAARAREVLLPILRIGLPQALEPFSYTVQSFVVSILVIGLGTAAMGANTYAQRFNFLDMAVSWSLTMAGQILMSHHLGAGRVEEVRRSYWRIAAISAGFAFASYLLIAVFRVPLLSLFTNDPAILGPASVLLLIALFMEPIRSINILGGIALKTVGDGKFSLAIGLAFMWGLIPLILLSNALGLGIVGIWCCLLLDETVRAGINAWRWRSGKWMGKVVIAEGSGG